MDTSAATAVAEAPTKPHPLANLTQSSAKIMPIVPTSMEQVWRVAQAIALAGWAPKAYQNPDKSFNSEMIAIGVMHGMEVGLTPIAALQSIAVINGMPSIWGDGALGLVQASGLLEDMKETLVRDTTGKVVGAKFTAKRRGRATLIEQQFLEADARKAGLIEKAGPWTQYPSRMYQMRARAWGLRDGFADVLRGLHIAEEAIDITPTSIDDRPSIGAGESSAGGAGDVVEQAPWAEEAFGAALKNWAKLIYSGKKTHDEIIALAESKNPLTDGQKAAIRTLKKRTEDAAPEGPASDVQIQTIQEKAEKAAITNAEIFKKFGITTFEGLPAAQVQPILDFIANPIGD